LEYFKAMQTLTNKSSTRALKNDKKKPKKKKKKKKHREKKKCPKKEIKK